VWSSKAGPVTAWLPAVDGESDYLGEGVYGHAVAAYDLLELPGYGSEAEALQQRVAFWELAWTLLAGAAIEIRYIAIDGEVRCQLLIRCSGPQQGDTEHELSRLGAALVRILGQAAPGMRLAQRAVDPEASVSGLPFAACECGDLMRSEIVLPVSGVEVDVPSLMRPGISSLASMFDEMKASPTGLCVSLAAAPTHIDSSERMVLEGELAQLERLGLAAGWPPDMQQHSEVTLDAGTPYARLNEAASMLTSRIVRPNRLGMLRVSIASEGEMPLAFRAASAVCLGWSGGALEYMPAAEPGEVAIFARNLETLGFTPWGVMVEAEEARRSVSDCYLASVPEIVTTVWLPPSVDGALTGTRIVEPAPRRVPSPVPSVGQLLGASRATLEHRPVALSEEDRSRHMYILGQTGTGKSTLAARMALEDIRAGKGVCVIDPHGDLVDEILDRYPEERADDLIIFDPQDEDRPLGLNLFETRNQAEQDFAIQQAISMLQRLYDPHSDGIVGPRFAHMLRMAALTVMAQPGGGTFLDVPLLYTNPDLLPGMLEHVKDPFVRSFWLDEQSRTSDYHKSEVLGWFVGKWGAYQSNMVMRRVLGQRNSAFDVREVMDSGKVLLVRLAKGQIGELNATILGMILVSKIQMAALGRADVPPAQRRRFHLYVDEFQSVTLSTFDELVAEARKYGLALTLLNQHVRQLPEHLRMALFGNVGTLAVFRLGVPDATLVAAEYGDIEVRDFVRLENFRAMVRMAVDGRVQPPFDVYTTALDPPEKPTPEWRRELERRSRETYGVSAQKAEDEAMRIFSGADDTFRFPV